MSNKGSLTGGITLETRLGNPIRNVQVLNLSAFIKGQFDPMGKRWQSSVTIRRGPTGTFNCHGLVFASRRTMIEDSPEVQRLIDEDGYVKVAPQDVKAGDLIVYVRNGDYEHSGIVIDAGPGRYIGGLLVPLVVSKWGSFWEVIHSANQCPYNFMGVEYYRQQRNMPKETI